MRKGIKKINLLSSIFFILLLVLVIFSRLTTSQVNPQEQNLDKENPLPLYLVSNVFSYDDFLLVDAGFGIEFFNNTNKLDPQYLGNSELNIIDTNLLAKDDQLYCIGYLYNETGQETYEIFSVYLIEEDATLELVREYYLTDSHREIIILENDTTLLLTINNDRQSLSLFNCTEAFEEIPIQYTHESFYSIDDRMSNFLYEDDFMFLHTYKTGGGNSTYAIFDLKNHTKPELLHSWSVPISITQYEDITVVNDLMYVITNDAYARVFSVAENRTIEELGILNTGRQYGYMKIVDNYAFLAEGVDFYLYNITEWDNIVQLSIYDTSEDQGQFDNFFVIEDLIYLSHYTSSTDNLLILLDWSDPSNPVFIRTFGFPHTDNFSAFVLAVPVVFLVFALGSSIRKMKKKKLNES